MKNLLKTIEEYIYNHTGTGTYRFVLPSYPSQLLLELGLRLEERYVNTETRFSYGIAYRLGQRWESSDKESDRSNFQAICQKGWYNFENNLTSLRNQLRTTEERLIIVMAGYDDIDDKTSLQEFHYLDHQAVWNTCLRKSFLNWVKVCFRTFDLEDEKDSLEKIADTLKAIYLQGLGDLLTISDFLDSIDFSVVMTVKDGLDLVLKRLSFFHLPNMSGAIGSKQNISNYFTPAHDFFSYNLFIEATSRKKYLDRIKKFKASAREIPDNALGPFCSTENLILALENYIEKQSISDRDDLYEADFVFIYEKILGFKEKGARPETKAKKLKGFPPEVFLRALWLTIGEYNTLSKRKAENIKTIIITSVAFKHNFNDEESGDKQAAKELAKRFLLKILGGIDEYLEDKLRFEVELNSNICPNDLERLSYEQKLTAEPALKFSITIASEDEDNFRREFLWAIPENHQVRLLSHLFDWAYEEFSRGGNDLPIYHIPYLHEIFMVNDEEELNRILTLAIDGEDRSYTNLLILPDRDPLKIFLFELSKKYQSFLERCNETGFYTAIKETYDGLRRAYSDAFKKYLDVSEQSMAGPLLLKAFLLTDNNRKVKDTWLWDEYLEAAIVTPLHPAMLEVIIHQYVFLCDAFSISIRKALEEPINRFLTEKRWNKIVNMAKMCWPLYGTLQKNHGLNTNVRSFDYFHLLGTSKGSSSWLDSRLLFQYEDDDEEEISDTELFMESKASVLITRILNDYRTSYPYADDGINIGAYCGMDLQPLIAGLDSYLGGMFKTNAEQPYSLRLTIISDSNDDSGVWRWINAWKERWQEVDAVSGKHTYANCQISISYRIISAGTEQRADNFVKLIQDSKLEFDLFFFMNFIKADISHFKSLDTVVLSRDYRKFPILEKLCCSLVGGGKETKRNRIINHQRLILGALHAEVMARLIGQDRNKKHAVISSCDYAPWQKVIDEIHQRCVWVVAIDAAVDEKLIQLSTNIGQGTREIIGFGTGVGSHGENNYTISTEHFSIIDIVNKIGVQVSDLFKENQDSLAIAESLSKETSNISGLSLVKATGPSQYVHDFMSYALIRKLLPVDNTVFCDTIISLDTFRHWFEDANDNQRPDLLRLKVGISEGMFDIQAQLIECKMADSSEGYLEKARQQLENGLKVLVPCFYPRESEAQEQCSKNDRFDQRYWWMQLHRLIAGKSEIEKSEEQNAIQLLERLSEGYYRISWQAAAVAFWTDQEKDFNSEARWDFTIDGQHLKISVATSGKDFVKEVCLQNIKGNIFGNNPTKLIYNSIPYKECSHDSGLDKIQTSSNKIDITQSPHLKLESQRDVQGDILKMTNPINENIKSVPQRIVLGISGEREICWEFGHPDLPNRHIIVFGASGTGKTYTIQALMLELAKSFHNSLIVDYTNGFTTNQLDKVIKEVLNPKQHLVRMFPLPINPFRKQYDLIDDIELEEEPQNTAERVTGVFSEVYNLGDQQKSTLYSVIQEGIIKQGNAFNLKDLLVLLENMQTNGGPGTNAAASVLSKIRPFVDMKPFGKEDVDSWEKLFSDKDSRCHILQLAGFSRDIAKLITEFSLIDLYRYCRAVGNKDNPIVVILDEIQNLDHRLESPLGQFLTEGRKFGISLVLATQTLSNLEKEERDRLFQASHKLFFKPAETEIRSFAQIIADSTRTRLDEWIEKLSALRKGECYSLGYALNEATGVLEVNKPFKIKIKSLDKRI